MAGIMSTREERQAAFRRGDRWLDDLHHRRPLVFGLLSLALGLGLFGLAMVLQAVAHFLSKGQHR